MNFLFPLVSAILQASSFTFDKVILSMRRVGFRGYIGASFPLYFAIVLLMFFIIRPPFELDALLSTRELLLFGASSLLVILANIMYYRALDRDTLGELLTFDLLNYIPIIIVSSIVFTDERNFTVLVPALIAALAVLWSHWEHHRFQIHKRTLPFFVFTIATAPIGAAISKVLLRTWHPISFELVRSILIAVIFAILFLRYAQKIPSRTFFYLVVTNVLTAVAWILYYYSYQRSGIIYTVLLFSLQPFLVYLASLLFLKEKFHPKKAIAFVVVLASIVIAQLLR